MEEDTWSHYLTAVSQRMPPSREKREKLNQALAQFAKIPPRVASAKAGALYRAISESIEAKGRVDPPDSESESGGERVETGRSLIARAIRDSESED